jgi:hypothetical protein
MGATPVMTKRMGIMVLILALLAATAWWFVFCFIDWVSVTPEKMENILTQKPRTLPDLAERLDRVSKGFLFVPGGGDLESFIRAQCAIERVYSPTTGWTGLAGEPEFCVWYGARSQEDPWKSVRFYYETSCLHGTLFGPQWNTERHYWIFVDERMNIVGWMKAKPYR